MKLLKSRFCGLLAGLFIASFGGLSSVKAEGEKAGDFDYYVMALSWSAGWCAAEGDRRGEPQCERGRGVSFVLHGLWPQYERGWPSHCRSAQRDPSRAQTAQVSELFGSAGAAFYQWKKHGRCTGLAVEDYFQTARLAFAQVTLPKVLEQVDREVRLPASVVEAAFLEANPELKADQVTVICSQGRIREVRICLDKALHPRRCGADVRRDCSLKDALLDPIR